MNEQLKSNDPLTENELEKKLNTATSNLFERINEINNEFNKLDINEIKGLDDLRVECDSLHELLGELHIDTIALTNTSDDTVKILFFYCSLIQKCLDIINLYESLKDNPKDNIHIFIISLLDLIQYYKKLNKLLQDLNKVNPKFIIDFLDKTDIPKTIFYFIVLTKQNIEEFVPSIIDVPKRIEFEFPFSQQIRVTQKNKKNDKNIKIPIRSHINSNPNSNPTLNPGLNQLVNSTRRKPMTIRSKYYICPPIFLETIIPKDYESKTSITIEANKKYYRVNIPKGLKAGTKISIEQPKVAILDVGQKPPYCNVKDKDLIISYYELVDSKIINIVTGLKFSGFKKYAL